ncbi:hypothetical protein HHK36_028432 [Tetracentron sinense]|uniref:CCHC-type domain-containing protein n=1 Tax=Tetracentron sinense TaxID=13715 RepID=A0A834YH81_TETSI|nr:hypothetical protein HHK36_028432 [Tetracentron sinense]
MPCEASTPVKESYTTRFQRQSSNPKPHNKEPYIPRFRHRQEVHMAGGLENLWPKWKTESIPVYDGQESYARNKNLPTYLDGYTNTAKMAEVPMNSVGIKLDIDRVDNIKKALDTWKHSMELCFALHNVWTVEECHAYAELSLVGGVKVFITDLFKAIDDESKALKTQYLEKYEEQRNVDGYVWLIHREYIGQIGQLSREKEQEVARIKLCKLQLCNLRFLKEYSNSFRYLYHLCGDRGNDLKNEYFRKIPHIGHTLKIGYQSYEGFDRARDNTIGERIQYVTDRLKYMKEAFDDQKTASKASKNLSLGKKKDKKFLKKRFFKKNDSKKKRVPNYRKDNSKKTFGKKCWTCGKEGHFAPQCPDKDKQANIVECMLAEADRQDLDVIYPFELTSFLEDDSEVSKSVYSVTEAIDSEEESETETDSGNSSKSYEVNMFQQTQTFKGKAPLEETMKLDFHDFENQKCWYAGTQGFLDKVKPGLYWQLDLKWSNQLVQCDRCRGTTTVIVWAHWLADDFRDFSFTASRARTKYSGAHKFCLKCAGDIFIFPATGVFSFNNFLFFIIFPDVSEVTTLLGAGGIFVLFGVIAILSLIFIYFIVPETKGLSLEEIEAKILLVLCYRLTLLSLAALASVPYYFDCRLKVLAQSFFIYVHRRAEDQKEAMRNGLITMEDVEMAVAEALFLGEPPYLNRASKFTNESSTLLSPADRGRVAAIAISESNPGEEAGSSHRMRAGELKREQARMLSMTYFVVA